MKKIIDYGINLLYDKIKELKDYCAQNLELEVIKDKVTYIEQIAKFGWTSCHDIMTIYKKINFIL